ADRRLRERELRLDRGDPAPDRRPAPRPDEADGVPDQHRARPGGRRAGAGGGAARAPDRGRRARRLRARAARPREPALHARRRAPGPPRGLLDRRVLPQHRAERLPIDPRRRGGAAAPPHREPRGRGDAAPSAETPPPRGGTVNISRTELQPVQEESAMHSIPGPGLAVPGCRFIRPRYRTVASAPGTTVASTAIYAHPEL